MAPEESAVGGGAPMAAPADSSNMLTKLDLDNRVQIAMVIHDAEV